MRAVARAVVAQSLVVCVALLGGAFDRHSLAARTATTADLLARSMAAYTSLTSYADTGTVELAQPGVSDTGKFKTYYRRQSSDFYFEFQEMTSGNKDIAIDMSANRVVLWMINGELEAFNQAFQTHETYPREGSNQPAVLQGAGAGTYGTSILIPSLIFAAANLPARSVRSSRHRRPASRTSAAGGVKS
jgi:hypothetical protein